ncbi:MAG: hypothetical protein RLZZ579_128 [Actinomycetota bacterium]|jgi:hypothetical protein
MEILFALIGGLTAYLNYRRAKAEGTLEPKPEKARKDPYVQMPLSPNAGRLEKIAHWLGLEER